MIAGARPQEVTDRGPASLAELEARLRRDLALLAEPARDWITPRRHPVHGRVLDVAIIGAGMAGMAAAFQLIRQGVSNTRLFDRAEPGREGPWVTFARMETLRSPKQLAGPALGLPSLTFGAWYEAQFGAEAWDRLGKIPRGLWMDYLRWYRRVARLPVENGVELVDMTDDEETGGVVLTLRTADGPRQVVARRVVLATGRDGLGGPFVPAVFDAVPQHLRAHSSDPIDFPALGGKRIAVIGAGASAIDNAAEALEAGAREVALLVRRRDIPRINKGMGVSSPGLTLGYASLPPDKRYAVHRYIADCQVPPPRDSMLRASRHPNFRVLTSRPILAARSQDDRIVLTTPAGELGFDYLILGTGFQVDWSRRPELSQLAPNVALWRHRHPLLGGEDGDLADHPCLGPWFEFEELEPGTAPWVRRVYCFNYAATLSQYKLTGDIPAISDGARRLAEGLVRSLFVEDYEDHYRRLVDYETPELRGDEWRREETEP